MSDRIALITRARSGEADAMERLVSENVGLVRSIALRFTNRGVDFEDLCQIGHIGMIKAIKNFDVERGCAFSTYAVPLIIGEIKRFLRDDGEIKIGREIKRKAALIMAEREKYQSTHADDPSVSMLARLCDLSEEEVVECISASAKTVSLSEPMGEDFSLEDTLGVDFTPELNEKIALKQAIARLPDEEKRIILLRYFRGLTQSEVGSILGLTQVTVSRRESRALSLLRSLLE